MWEDIIYKAKEGGLDVVETYVFWNVFIMPFFHGQLVGLNSMLAVEHLPSILVSKVLTLILGMDVSHGPPGQSDVPSIAAVNTFI
jgi:hypothetical protein